MSIYQIALFLHVLGALGLFIGIGFEWLCLSRINNTTSIERLKEWVNFLHSLKNIFSSSALVLLLSGIYMTVVTWGGVAWIAVAFIGLVFSSINGAVVSGKKIASLQKVINDSNSDLSGNVLEQKQYQKLLSHFQLRSAIAVSIIYMMTFKPELTGSVAAFVLAFIIGSLPVFTSKKSVDTEFAGK